MAVAARRHILRRLRVRTFTEELAEPDCRTFYECMEFKPQARNAWVSDATGNVLLRL